jgi:hypothetical protein
MFRQYIVDPLFSADEDPYRNLRLLLQSVCLRRTQNQSNFPATYQQVTLTLSLLEKTHYDKVLEETKRKMDMLVNTGSPLQKYAQLFTVMLRLRRLCSLGQLSAESRSLPLSNSSSPNWNSANSNNSRDFGCEFCTKEDSLDLMKDLTFCPNCSRVLTTVHLENGNMLSESFETEFLRVPKSPSCIEAAVFDDRCLASSQGSSLETCLLTKVYPTKLLEVATRLRESHCKSKRFGDLLQGPVVCFPDTYLVLSSPVGRRHWMFLANYSANVNFNMFKLMGMSVA